MFKWRRRRPRRGLLEHLFAWLRNLIVLGALVAGGAWLYVTYQLRGAMDDIAKRVAPAGTLTYEGVFWHFGADLGARGISLVPGRGLDVPMLRVDEAVVHTPGVLYVLGFRGDDVLPLTMGATLRGLRQEGDAGTDESAGSYSGLPFEALGCGDVSSFRTPDLRSMGLDDVAGDLSGRYFISPPERIDLTLIHEVGGVAESSLELGLIVPNLSAANRGGAVPDVRLASLKLTLDASEFNQRRNSYCARRAGVSISEFLDRHQREVVAALRQQRLLAGPSVLEQYAQFAAGRGPWVFISRPDRPLPVASLAVADPLALIERLSLNSALQTAVASPVIVTRVGAAVPRTEGEPATPESSQTLPSVPAGSGLTAETGIVRQTRWVRVEVAAASRYVDRNVRITTRFGQEYSGRLAEVADGQMLVESRFPGGEAVVPIPLEHIAEIKVMEQ